MNQNDLNNHLTRLGSKIVRDWYKKHSLPQVMQNEKLEFQQLLIILWKTPQSGVQKGLWSNELVHHMKRQSFMWALSWYKQILSVHFQIGFSDLSNSW